MQVINLNKSTIVICIILSVVASQRILLPGIHEYICVIFALLSLLYKNDKSISLSFVIFSIFTLVDNGAAVYPETNSLVRYSIYIYACVVVFYNTRFHLNKLCLALFFISMVLTISLFNINVIDPDIFKRDIVILSLFVLVFSRVHLPHKELINYSLLVILLVAFMIGELLNISRYDGFVDYMSYDTTKSLVLLPIIYAVSKRKTHLFIALIPLTLAIIVAYVTRMVILSFSFVLVLFIFSYLKNSFRYKMALLAIFIGMVILAPFISKTELESVKFFGTIFEATEQSNLLDAISSIDPVRYYEGVALLEQGPMHILLGNGIGSGYVDVNNNFSFVGQYDSAFSNAEILNGVFFNFHDLWTDIGYRLGLIFILTLLYLPARYMLGHSDEFQLLGLMIFSLLLCSFFSYSGVILIAIFYSSLMSRREYNKSND